MDEETIRNHDELYDKAINYYHDNNFEQALPLFIKLYELKKNDDEEIDTIMFWIGNTCYFLDDINNSFIFLEESYKIRIDKYKMDDPLVSNIQFHYAKTLFKLDRVEEALLIFQTVLPNRIKQLGKNDSIVIDIEDWIGYCFYTLKKYEESLKIYLNLRNRSTEVLRAKILGFIGTNLSALKRDHEAVKFFEESYLEAKKHVDEPNELLATTSLNYADALVIIGKYSKASKKFDEYFELYDKLKYEYNFGWFDFRMLHADLYYRQGNYEKALDIFENAYDIGRTLKIKNPNYVASAKNQVAHVLYDLERYEEATEHFLGLYESFKDIYGKNSYDASLILSWIGSCYYILEDYKKALKYYKKCFEKLKLILEPDNDTLKTVKYSYANALYEIERYEEALVLYRELYLNEYKSGDENEYLIPLCDTLLHLDMYDEYDELVKGNIKINNKIH